MTFVAAAFLAMMAQDDLLYTLEGREVQGEVVGFDSEGYVEYRERGSGKLLRVAVEEVTRICLGKSATVKVDAKADRIRLLTGDVLSGRITTYGNDLAVLEGGMGKLTVRREEIRTISFGAQELEDPEELRDAFTDLMIREEEGKAKAEYGRLESIGAEVVLRGEEEEELRFERAGVRRIQLHHANPAALPDPGWFAKVVLRNGDRLVAVPSACRGDSLHFFSGVLGKVAIERRLLASISFRPNSRLVLGCFVVCMRNQVKLLDESGRELWVYDERVRAQRARMLGNGNVLISNSSYGQVLEVRPEGKRGGRIVWRKDNLSRPVDAVRRDNGNLIVAETGKSCVAEYPRAGGDAVWKYSVTNPMKIDCLANGNTLISARRKVVEVDRAGKVTWSLKPAEQRYMARAQRLENGNTLVAFAYDECVVEYNARSEEVWRMDDVGMPLDAIRTEEGRTFILDQNAGMIFEVDRNRKMLRKIQGLDGVASFSVY